MDWNRDKSVRLSRFCVYLFMVLLCCVCIGAPWLFRGLIRLRGEPAAKLPLFLVTVYTAAVPAAMALWDLRCMLRLIAGGDVFVPENVRALRRLSWECIAGGLICLASTAYYPSFLCISAAAAFIGLILRVVKNVFDEAVRIKNENDFTI